MKTYLTIWFKTLETLDYVLSNHKHTNKFSWIFYVAALTSAIPILLSKEPLELSIYVIIPIIIVGALLGGFIGQHLWVFIFWIIGKILNGKADREDIRIVLAYSLMPVLFKLVIILIRVIVSIGSTNDFSDIGKFNYLTDTVIMLLSIRIFILGLSRVQKFSYVLAALNIIMPIVILGSIGYFLRF